MRLALLTTLTILLLACGRPHPAHVYNCINLQEAGVRCFRPDGSMFRLRVEKFKVVIP